MANQCLMVNINLYLLNHSNSTTISISISISHISFNHIIPGIPTISEDHLIHLNNNRTNHSTRTKIRDRGIRGTLIRTSNNLGMAGEDLEVVIILVDQEDIHLWAYLDLDLRRCRMGMLTDTDKKGMGGKVDWAMDPVDKDMDRDTNTETVMRTQTHLHRPKHLQIQILIKYTLNTSHTPPDPLIILISKMDPPDLVRPRTPISRQTIHTISAVVSDTPHIPLHQ